MHSSVKLDIPCEPINITPLNPLISKCQIKVCYVGDEPNRNRSVISKEVAKQIANSIPGSPIVGFFNETKEDFEEHNREIHVSNGEFTIKDSTRPYGFVDLGAKVWFQKFLDDGVNEHEYLMTEGYLWTGQYPEAQRIIDKGNNQSMELHKDTIDAYWTKDNNEKPQFFIINEAIMEKLCILGEDIEPCFEGANITDVQFSLDDGFKEQLSSMMAELKEFLEKGGRTKVFTQYALEIGDKMFRTLHDHLRANYNKDFYLKAVYQEGEQKFAIIAECCGEKLYRMDFDYSEEGFAAKDLVEVEETYVPVTNTSFSLEDIQAFEEAEFKKNEDKDDKEDKKKTDNNSEEDKSEDSSDESEEEKNEEEDDEEEEDKKKNKYSLEDIPEYTELLARYSDLESKYNNLVVEKEQLESQLEPLREFKLETERLHKQDMINKTFYMLSDEDKKDVIENIDKYSLEDIEAKLSVICVRNKVSFAALEDDNEGEQASDPTVYNLGANLFENEGGAPAWVKAVLETQQKH